MIEPTNHETNTTMSDSITANYAEQIAQLTKERDSLRIELDKLQCAYGNVCDNAAITEKERDQLAAQLKELRGHIRCIYCNEKYTAEQSDALADHILSCEKSPLVQTNAELMAVANLLIDSSDPDSVIIEAEKRIKALPVNSILKQRDDYKDKLALSESQVVQLLDENNSLKLDYSHSEAENAQLAAKKAVLVGALERIAANSYDHDTRTAAKQALEATQ